jgi:hypothetical protein
MIYAQIASSCPSLLNIFLAAQPTTQSFAQWTFGLIPGHPWHFSQTCHLLIIFSLGPPSPFPLNRLNLRLEAALGENGPDWMFYYLAMNNNNNDDNLFPLSVSRRR